MPVLLLTIVAIFWGASYVLIKIALQDLAPLSFVFLRFLVATVCLLPSLVFLREKIKTQVAIRGTQLGVLLWGIIVLQTIGLQTITPSVSSFLMGFAVVFILIIRFVVQRQAPSLLDLTASLTCTVGLGLITRSQGLVWEPGVYYTLGGAFFVALHTYALAVCVNRYHFLILTFFQMLVVSLLTGIAAFTVGHTIQVPVQPSAWAAILLCGIFCSAVCSCLQAYAQKCLSAFQAYMVTTSEPVFSTIFSCLFLGEVPTLSFYFGMVLILGSISLINWRITEFKA